MPPAGLERHVDIRGRTKTLADRIARDRRPAMLDGRPFQSIAPMPAERRTDRAAAREHPRADGRIGPVALAPLEALREDVLRMKRPRDDQEPARVLVEPVDQPRAEQRGEGGIEMQQ